MSALGRIAQLHRELAEAYEQAAGETGDQYVDQHASPLGSRLHCRLVRSGALAGYRAGRRILVRMSDIATYLEAHRVPVSEPAVGKLDEDEELLGRIGGGKANVRRVA